MKDTKINEMKDTKIIEINGVKLEVDLRTAKRVDQIRVGDKVKVLKKQYSDYKVYHGVVIGFEPFEKLPTIIVACAIVEYSSAKMDFIYYNSQTKDVEIVVANNDDEAALDQNDFISKIDSEILKKEAEITELNDRKNYFLAKFKTYWTPTKAD